MQQSLFIVLAVLMGIALSIYLPMNSSLSKHIGSTVTAVLIFFVVALSTLILIFLIFGELGSIRHIKNVPLYLYSTGFFAALVVLGITYLIPHLGARRLFILVVSSQVLMAVIVSHFGILESPKDPVTIKKIVGALVVVLGAYISTSG